MSVVTWFEIPAQKLDRAKKFYEHILGLNLTHVEMGPQVMELFQELHKQGMTIVIVTHDANIAKYAARVVTFRDGNVISDERKARAS